MNTSYKQSVPGIVNLNPHPPIPHDIAGAEIVENFHHDMGKVEIRERDSSLYLDGREVELLHFTTRKRGFSFQEELVKQNKTLLNANILFHLLEFPKLIPSKWAGLRVCFWGTTYHKDERLFIPRLDYRGDATSEAKDLEEIWTEQEPAAVLTEK